MLTTSQFSTLFPRATDPAGWVDALNEAFTQYNINTPKRMAAFLAQCGHESAGWTIFEENLNYSASGLRKVFGKYFPTDALAIKYQRKPEMIANRVYANRMGNGTEESGDGWKYRGRGPIQLTGKSNYTRFAKDMFENWEVVVEHPEWVSYDKKYAIMSAVWFWNTNNLNQYADSEDIRQMTRKINGGYNGLNDRIKHYNEAIHLLE